MSKSKSKAVTSGGAKTLVYCGPTIPHICNKYAMFSAIPDALEKKAVELPLIRELIIPISRFAEERVKLERGEGALFGIYQEIKKSI